MLMLSLCVYYDLYGTVKLGHYDTDLMLSEEKANQFVIIASLLPAIDTCTSVWIPI